MTAAPTPPPHTPIVLLKAGAGQWFSAQCLDLLAQAGYQGDDFGSYEHVAERCSDARARVNAYWTARRQGVTPLPPRPTPHDHFLASCQGGHLQQNACFQGSGGRGNPCRNVVDGYETDLYPCMPHQGNADTAGSEHNWVSCREELDPRTDRSTQPPTTRNTNDVYPRNAMDRDADQRTRDLPRLNNGPQPTGGGGMAGQGVAAQAAAGPGGPSDAAGVAAARPAIGPIAGPGGITGESAADCINNFRRAGENAMKQHCIDQIPARQRIANGGANRTDAEGQRYRDRLRRRAEQRTRQREGAERALGDARDQRDRAQAAFRYRRNRLREAQRAVPPNPAAVSQRRDDLRAALRERADARAGVATAEDRVRRATVREERAATRSSRVERAQCRVEQGRRLQGAPGAGPPRTDGRVPGLSDNPDERWPRPPTDGSHPVNLIPRSLYPD